MYAQLDRLPGFVAGVCPDNNHVPFACDINATLVTSIHEICFSSSVNRESKSSGSFQLNLASAIAVSGFPGARGIHFVEARRIVCPICGCHGARSRNGIIERNNIERNDMTAAHPLEQRSRSIDGDCPKSRHQPKLIGKF